MLGDLFLDRYLDIDAALTEPSIETGLDAYQVVARAVLSRGGGHGHQQPRRPRRRPHRARSPCIGDDGEGYELRQALRAAAGVDAGAASSPRRTAARRRTPSRCCASRRAARELNRLDIKNRTPTPDRVQDRVIDAAGRRLAAARCADRARSGERGGLRRGDEPACATGSPIWAAANPDKFVLADSRERIGGFATSAVKLEPSRVHGRCRHDRLQRVPASSSSCAPVGP